MTRHDGRPRPPAAARAAPDAPARAPAHVEAEAEADADASFREAVRDVRRLPPSPAIPEPPRPPPRARFRRADDDAVLAESLELGPGELMVETGDELLFRRADLATRTLDQLRRGEFAVAGEIDLHGLTATQAREVVREFLNDAARRGLRCVRVIHGKGLRSGPRGPVLKHAVNTWLRRHAAVVAFASARPVDGGTGAVYVLLAR